MRKPKILISSCLLGLPARYNGAQEVHPFVEALEEKYELIAVCPEMLGGLAVPRPPAEIVGKRVIDKEGRDVTYEYEEGAQRVLDIAKGLSIKLAVFQERSPSCGHGWIHDGTFTDGMVEGDGICAKLLLENGIRIVGDSRIEELL
ncbi:MAG TPA: DUF523 domain-containing protein [Clostridiales bacterium]|jgi:uncharacterized protein YbbK (DUF523 family)|nr:DUF523 domain-containing protein [Clostridiales bacterium]